VFLPREETEEIRKAALTFVQSMDDIEPGPSTVFKGERSKTDLEHKVWSLHFKVVAADYHLTRISFFTSSARSCFNYFLNAEPVEFSPGATATARMMFTCEELRFEIDAFFMALRSALDFLACVLSRYLKGKKTDRWKGLLNHTKDSDDRLARIARAAHDEWAEDMIEYRNHLTHSGVLQPTYGTAVVWENLDPNEDVREAVAETQRRQASVAGGQNAIAFPIPATPNKEARLHRSHVLGHGPLPNVPEGIVERELGEKAVQGGRLVESRTAQRQLLIPENDNYISPS